MEHPRGGEQYRDLLRPVFQRSVRVIAVSPVQSATGSEQYPLACMPVHWPRAERSNRSQTGGLTDPCDPAQSLPTSAARPPYRPTLSSRREWTVHLWLVSVLVPGPRTNACQMTRRQLIG